MSRILALFSYFAVICFSAGSVGYILLRVVMPDGWVFGALYRMFLYHWEHPFQYIAIVSIIYAAVASTAALALRHRQKTSRWMIFAVMAVTILVASPLGGVLWVIHDMQAGYFTEGSRFWRDIGWGALEGIRCGWLIILLSVPYNLLGVVAGYFVTTYGFRMARPEPSRHGSLPSLSSLGVQLTKRKQAQPQG